MTGWHWLINGVVIGVIVLAIWFFFGHRLLKRGGNDGA